VWNHIYHHDEKGPEARNNISIKALSDALFRNRKLLEGLPFELTTFYGDKRFKCPRVKCFYFYEGFRDAKSRDKHINHHDRPFNCIFPGCSIAEIGFASNKDLEKHERLFHPEIEHQAIAFTTTPKPTTQTKWDCKLCGKNFTRGFHQRNHLRSHTGERPYSCSECGKAFTRENDRKRHEKIHARR
jgi:Zinc finger, C2H2 type